MALYMNMRMIPDICMLIDKSILIALSHALVALPSRSHTVYAVKKGYCILFPKY